MNKRVTVRIRATSGGAERVFGGNTILGSGSTPGTQGGGGGFVDLSEISAFPVLTREIDGWSGGSSGQRTEGLSSTVERELRTVLGGLPRAQDPETIQRALTQAFELKQYEGRTIATWVPRTYTGLINTGPGVTGAQASLAAFARNALDTSLPLLDSLSSLIVDTDPQELEAARSILRQAWVAFVDELALEGGPRVARARFLADDLQLEFVPAFGRLVGALDANGDLSRDLVVTPEEERRLTDFIVVRDYITATIDAAQRFANEFLGTGERDLGTTLVRVERALSVVGESVDEVYAALDSVFIGPDERLTIVIDVVGGGADDEDFTIEELLSWISYFAKVEAPQLIEGAGRRGLPIISRTAEFELAPRVELMRNFFVANFDQRSGLRHPRVINSLVSLEESLDRVVAALATDGFGPLTLAPDQAPPPSAASRQLSAPARPQGRGSRRGV